VIDGISGLLGRSADAAFVLRHADSRRIERGPCLVCNGFKSAIDVSPIIRQPSRKAQLELRLALGLGKMDGDALAFPADLDAGAPISPGAFSAEWRGVADHTGMVGVPLHSRRHTHASQLIDAGVRDDIEAPGARLACHHFKVYAHLFRKDDGKAPDAINAALAGKGRT
jgi:hypothetical protein